MVQSSEWMKYWAERIKSTRNQRVMSPFVILIAVIVPGGAHFTTNYRLQASKACVWLISQQQYLQDDFLQV